MQLLSVLLTALLLAACNAVPPAEESSPAMNEEQGQILEGTLGGDPQLEGGCSWLDTEDGRFEVLYPEGYDIAFEPVRLLDPEGDTVAEEGDEVRLRGRVSGDIVTVCQVGTVFEADEVLSAS